jgi:CRP-like cAMP-binding protein
MNRHHHPKRGNREICAQLARLTLFEGIEAKTLQGLAASTQLLELPKRDILIQHGQRLDEVYALLDGSMKAYLLSCSGQQRVVQLLQPGDTVGEALLFNQMASPIFVEAMSGCTVLAIPGEDLLDLLRNSNAASLRMVRTLSARVQQLLLDLEGCCLQNALQRIAQYLCTLSCHCFEENLQIELPASKVVVASLLNLTPETLSRGLHQLADAGHITIERRIIHLSDPDALKEVAAGKAQIG